MKVFSEGAKTAGMENGDYHGDVVLRRTVPSMMLWEGGETREIHKTAVSIFTLLTPRRLDWQALTASRLSLTPPTPSLPPRLSPRKKVHTLAMTAVSFHQIDFTFDRRVMSAILNECRELLHQAIRRHLTAKSHSRVNHVFNHFADCDFLAALYGPSEIYRAHLQKICNGVNKMLDEGSL